MNRMSERLLVGDRVRIRSAAMHEDSCPDCNNEGTVVEQASPGYLRVDLGEVCDVHTIAENHLERIGERQSALVASMPPGGDLAFGQFTLSADPINHPPHYGGRVETIDAIEAWGLGYLLGNVVKYVSRADRKGNAVEDLRKAAWYLNREINIRTQGST